MEVSDHLHAPAASSPGTGPLYPLDRRLGGPQRWKNSRPFEVGFQEVGYEGEI